MEIVLVVLGVCLGVALTVYAAKKVIDWLNKGGWF